MYFKNLFSNSIASSLSILCQFEMPLDQFFCKSCILRYNTFINAFSFINAPFPFVTLLSPLFKLSIEEICDNISNKLKNIDASNRLREKNV